MSAGMGDAERILVVDDEAHTRGLLKELCESSGFEVILAEAGAAVLELARAHRPDLVLLDLMMPEVDGFEVLRQMKADEALKELPVIIVSANTDVGGKIRGLELGADDYVTKPFKLFELVTRIRSALALKRYRQKLKVAEEELAELKGGDAATGAGTYPQLKAVLDYEVTRARRYGRPLAAIYLSLDGFAALRGELARESADRVVARAADVVRSQVRNVDRLFRLDDEEFVVLLPETDSSGAARAAERIAQAVASASFPEVGAPLMLSAGTAVFPGEGVRSPEELVRAASDALRRRREDATG